MTKRIGIGGFTLIELLLVVGMVLLSAGILTGLVATVYDHYFTIVRSADREQSFTRFFATLSSDIASAVAFPQTFTHNGELFVATAGASQPPSTLIYQVPSLIGGERSGDSVDTVVVTRDGGRVRYLFVPSSNSSRPSADRTLVENVTSLEFFQSTGKNRTVTVTIGVKVEIGAMERRDSRTMTLRGFNAA